MASIFALSFRDLEGRFSNGLTTGDAFEIRGADQDFDWTDPPFRRRWRNRGASGRGTLHAVEMQKLLDLWSGKHICFVIHGFNVDRNRGFMATGATSKALSAHAGVLRNTSAPETTRHTPDLYIPVLWPGDWVMPGINYSFEYGDARRIGIRLAELISDREKAPRRISFITHSFGIRIALETLRRIESRKVVRIELGLSTFLAGADDKTVLDQSPWPEFSDEEWRKTLAKFSRIVVAYSKTDKTLQFAFPIGDAVEASIWHGQKTLEGAIGRHGPVETDDPTMRRRIWLWDLTDEGHDHGHYLPRPWETGASQDSTTRRRRVMEMLKAHAVLPPRSPVQPPLNNMDDAV